MPGPGNSAAESKSSHQSEVLYAEWREFRELAKPQYFRMLAVINRALDSVNLPVPPPHLLSLPATTAWRRTTVSSDERPDATPDSCQLDT